MAAVLPLDTCSIEPSINDLALHEGHLHEYLVLFVLFVEFYQCLKKLKLYIKVHLEIAIFKKKSLCVISGLFFALSIQNYRVLIP